MVRVGFGRLIAGQWWSGCAPGRLVVGHLIAASMSLVSVLLPNLE